MRLHAIALVLSAACLLAACSAHKTASAPDALPDSAIEIRDGLYAVPVGADETGCMRYTLKAPGRMTDQAIRWPAKGGGFTANRAEADCPPPKG